MMKWRLLCCAICLLGLSGCASYQTVAPVADADTTYHANYAAHRVQMGETLYSIAWHYHTNVRHLAQLNQLSAPYGVRPGEYIRVDSLGESDSVLA